MTKFKPCSSRSESCYAIAADGRSVTFLPCGITSHHPMDVQHRYCALCHSFIERSRDSDGTRSAETA
jgi:hypothetical protein